MTQPTGVFVRLPLSDNEKMALTSGVKMGGSIEQGILAIGTPVTGGKLEKLTHSLLSAGIRQALAPNWPDGLFAMHAKADLMAQEIMTENPTHQAAIAALEAEVGRLRNVVGAARTSIATGNPMKAAYVLETSLKGPEA